MMNKSFFAIMLVRETLFRDGIACKTFKCRGHIARKTFWLVTRTDNGEILDRKMQLLHVYITLQI